MRRDRVLQIAYHSFRRGEASTFEMEAVVREAL